MSADRGRAVDCFNADAKAHHWAWSCDPLLDVQSPVLAKAFLAWKTFAEDGRIPERHELSLSAVKGFIGHMMIVERLSDQRPRYRIRLMGSRLAAAMGELQGMIIDEQFQIDDSERWYAAFEATLAHQAPLRFVSQLPTVELEFLQAELLMAPLLDDHARPTQVLVAIAFQARPRHSLTLDEFIASRIEHGR